MHDLHRPTKAMTTPQTAAGPKAMPLTGMAALQQRAGNAAATRWVQRKKDQKDQEDQKDPLEEHYATRPTKHPEWETYQKLTQAAGIPQDEADAAWQLLLGGVDSQPALNAEAAAQTSDRQKQREIRATNTWYHEFVKLMTKHMELETPTMALWAGGDGVSEYARSRGHTPLAATRIGRVLDVLKVHADWKLTGPMWNVLSKAFVNLATGPVHIFVRAYEPDSILIRLEVPELHLVQRLNPDVEMIWHPLYTESNGRTREISPDCRLVDNAEYDGRDKCVSVLYRYLRQFHDSGNEKAAPAHQSMKRILTENGHKDGV